MLNTLSVPRTLASPLQRREGLACPRVPHPHRAVLSQRRPSDCRPLTNSHETRHVASVPPSRCTPASRAHLLVPSSDNPHVPFSPPLAQRLPSGDQLRLLTSHVLCVPPARERLARPRVPHLHRPVQRHRWPSDHRPVTNSRSDTVFLLSAIRPFAAPLQRRQPTRPVRSVPHSHGPVRRRRWPSDRRPRTKSPAHTLPR